MNSGCAGPASTLAVSTLPICGPPGSTATIACTELRTLLGDVEAEAAALRVREQDHRRADHVEQRDAGGARSAPVAPANCTCVLMKLSKIGSPILPVPGHCVWFIFSGKSPRSRAFVQMRSSSSAVRMLEVAVDRRLAVGARQRHVRRSAARRVVHHVDDVALRRSGGTPSPPGRPASAASPRRSGRCRGTSTIG